MKYYQGDRVRLKQWSPEYEDMGFGTVMEMEPLFGTVVTVRHARPMGFSIVEDGGEWQWEYHWIQTEPPKVKLPEELFEL